MTPSPLSSLSNDPSLPATLPSQPETPEPGRRTPLAERYVDLHADNATLRTKVFTLLNCHYGRATFSNQWPRPQQEAGRYQLFLDFNAKVLQTTLSTLRTGCIAKPNALANSVEFAEYQQQLQFFGVDPQLGETDALAQFAARKALLDEVLDLFKAGGLLTHDTGMALGTPFVSCAVDQVGVAYLPKNAMTPFAAVFLKALGAADLQKDFDKSPYFNTWTFKVSHKPSTLAAAAGLRARVKRVSQFTGILSAMHGAGWQKPDGFSQPLRQLCAAFLDCTANASRELTITVEANCLFRGPWYVEQMKHVRCKVEVLHEWDNGANGTAVWPDRPQPATKFYYDVRVSLMD